MNRRAFVTGFAGLLAVPLAAEAQQERVYKIGYLGLGAGPALQREHFAKNFANADGPKGKTSRLNTDGSRPARRDLRL